MEKTRESSQAQANTMDAYEAMDTFAMQSDVASLKRELERVHPRLAVGLFEDPKNVAADLQNFRGRIVEMSPDEGACYALLCLAKVPGFEGVRGIVHDLAYHLMGHPSRIAAIRALKRQGDVAASSILDEVERGSTSARQKFLGSLGHGDVSIGPGADPHWNRVGDTSRQ